MSNIFDTDESLDSTQLKFLETLIEKLIKRLEEDSYKPKVQDALKAIQLKQKLVKTSEAEKIFWDEIEAIRQEELPKLYAEEAVSLETQIQNTILGLKDQVKNGILPIKIITDTFNQGKSKETSSVIAASASSSPTWGSERQKPTPAPTPSSGMTIFYLRILLLTLKKMKNSHPQIPQVPHIPQVQPIGQFCRSSMAQSA